MKHCKQAFTLIELLVVICIIAILASMLLPALQSARESASTATCISNLGQFAKAFQMYATSYNDFMPALTDPQKSSAKSGWECALVEAIGQDPEKNAPFKNSFFCDADSGEGGGGKKSYSLNNLQDAIHPRNLNMLDTKGALFALKSGKTDVGGYISGNKTTSVFTASDLIIIGENASESNTINWNGGTGNAKFDSKSTSTPDSPGSASAILQQIQIKPQRLTSHKTAGELFLDGHVKHVPPQQTLPSKKNDGKPNSNFFIENKTSYGELSKKLASTAWGSWTDCPKRKIGEDCSEDSACHKK